ncbi:MAG: hypothetical protein QOE75_2212 [Solirubrobacterales bacterium]|nr:hypothetical protein [Solirubrobacterales bacterium]
MALCALVLVAVGAAGCGEEEGVADGAVVTAYVEAPLCGGGTDDVSVSVPEGDEPFDVRVVCLPDARGTELSQGVGGGRQIDLAAVGANARRATEDSSAIAYLQTGDPAISRFTRPILEAAGIGILTADTRREAMRRLLAILAESDSDDLRADVRDALGQ